MPAPAVIGPFRDQHRFLSNFFVEKDGKTNEHRFQTPKTLDKEARKRIWNAKGPKEAKRLASKRGFEQLSQELGRPIELREDWDSICDDVMLWGLRKKFEDPELAQQLLDTGDAELVEFNVWHDRRWGRCTCAEHQGQGENRLGQLLMQVRSELRRGEEPPEPDHRLRVSPLAA